MSRLLIGVVALLLLLAACGSDSGRGTVVGSVIAVDGDLVSVNSFVVLSDGQQFLFVPQLGGDFSIPLVHLRDHLRSGSPVRVTFVGEQDNLVATDVVDADPHS